MKNGVTEKDARFKDVASRRTESILRSIRSLSKCSNTRNYFYSESQIRKIFKTIQEELDSCKRGFSSMNGKKRFQL